MEADPFDLQRFVDAQQANSSYQRAVDELGRGRKASHWMWYVFPQIAGLGHSAMSQKFAISGAEEAVEYLRHPVLGARLRACVELLATIDERSAEQIFGSVDAQKLHSSMTLFHLVASDQPAFNTVLVRFFGGQLDQATVDRL